MPLLRELVNSGLNTQAVNPDANGRARKRARSPGVGHSQKLALSKQEVTYGLQVEVHISKKSNRRPGVLDCRTGIRTPSDDRGPSRV